jgi:hypothetical protein
MRLMSSFVFAGAVAALAACAPPPAAHSPGEGPDEGSGMAWRCDADAAQSLIGSHNGAVTFPRNSNVRMACTTCAVTQDYQEDRLNLFFNQETGIIERVSCG